MFKLSTELLVVNLACTYFIQKQNYKKTLEFFDSLKRFLSSVKINWVYRQQQSNGSYQIELLSTINQSTRTNLTTISESLSRLLKAFETWFQEIDDDWVNN